MPRKAGPADSCELTGLERQLLVLFIECSVHLSPFKYSL